MNQFAQIIQDAHKEPLKIEANKISGKQFPSLFSSPSPFFPLHFVYESNINQPIPF